MLHRLRMDKDLVVDKNVEYVKRATKQNHRLHCLTEHGKQLESALTQQLKKTNYTKEMLQQQQTKQLQPFANQLLQLKQIAKQKQKINRTIRTQAKHVLTQVKITTNYNIYS